MTDSDLWTLMVAAIGQRIDSPAAAALIEAIGAKPLKPATPANETTYTTAKAFDIEIAATSNPKIRTCWPPRKEGRLWVTYIHHIELKPRYAGPLPPGIHWGMSKEELAAIGSFYLRGAIETPCWILPAPCEGVVLEAESSEKQPLASLSLHLPYEIDYIAANADYEKKKPLVYIEDAFFTAWCALNGLLRPEKFTSETLTPLRERQITPLQFLHESPCARLLWSGDVKPEFRGFMSNYYLGLFIPDSQGWITDINTVFGKSNHFRREGEMPMQDSWENYDRIAPTITRRFDEWRQGKLKPTRE